MGYSTRKWKVAIASVLSGMYIFLTVFTNKENGVAVADIRNVHVQRVEFHVAEKIEFVIEDHGK